MMPFLFVQRWHLEHQVFGVRAHCALPWLCLWCRLHTGCSWSTLCCSLDVGTTCRQDYTLWWPSLLKTGDGYSFIRVGLGARKKERTVLLQITTRIGIFISIIQLEKLDLLNCGWTTSRGKTWKYKSFACVCLCVWSEGLTCRVKVSKVPRTHLHDGPWSRVHPAHPAVPGAVTVRAYRGQHRRDTGCADTAKTKKPKPKNLVTFFFYTRPKHSS